MYCTAKIHLLHVNLIISVFKYYYDDIFEDTDSCEKMHGVRRLACAICMILILIFAIIHLGVAGGIIGRFNRYGDIFRPEIGLAGFNLAIGVYAFLIGVFGLFAVLTDRGNLSEYAFFRYKQLLVIIHR